MPRYYLTTPIYYPNAEPHIGHCYTTIAADTLARYHRLAGDDTYFLTGTDEHGVKMVKTAAEQGIEPAALADQMAGAFQQAWKELEITNDDFIRTTDPRHKAGVRIIVEQLLANGDIYLGGYEGWYDEGQEEFVTETAAKDQQYKSAISGRPLVRYKEDSYFFRIAKYAPRVLEYIREHPEFIAPASRRNEVLSKLGQGVDDLSISRSTLKWGIPMPNDPKHVVYVWIDALSNYITALGYGSPAARLFEKFWPADLHLIGKEILWFHAVYWPAMLMSLGLPIPKRIFAHGWWTADGKKMSKSMGNFIGLEKLREIGKAHGYDALRYYLLRAAPFGADLDWTEGDFNKSFNELANVVGNCLNRTLNMAGKYRGKLPPLGSLEDIDRNLIAQTQRLSQQLAGAYEKCELQQCALLPVELARTTNGYIDATAPFKLAKDPALAGRLDTVLHVSAQAIYAVLVGLLPILPEKAAAGLKQLGVNIEGKTPKQLLADGLPADHPIVAGQPLFPKVLPAGSTNS
ncbi:MAG TPA: methionine--tRNA ligase [Tepidisphaeraceae bacterium]|nr:methionine--tRNA ligase [Tepidisphaeraceae bacterium]